MADIKKDPAQDWDLSDEYYQENPQSDELRLEDFMDSSSKESAETTGTFLSDRHTALPSWCPGQQHYPARARQLPPSQRSWT